MSSDEVTIQGRPIILDAEARRRLGQAYALLIELGRRAREQRRTEGAAAGSPTTPTADAPAAQPAAQP